MRAVRELDYLPVAALYRRENRRHVSCPQLTPLSRSPSFLRERSPKLVLVQHGIVFSERPPAWDSCRELAGVGFRVPRQGHLGHGSHLTAKIGEVHTPANLY